MAYFMLHIFYHNTVSKMPAIAVGFLNHIQDREGRDGELLRFDGTRTE